LAADRNRTAIPPVGSYIAPHYEATNPITVDVLVSDQQRREGWVQAMAEFEKAVAERSEED
jgi:hypothetical protein